MPKPSGPAVGHVVDALSPAGALFRMVVSTNIERATPWTPPPAYAERLLEYAALHVADGAILRSGLARDPTFYRGGWLLDVQKNALAITLDRAIFFQGTDLDVVTWAHELVHVHQYGAVGTTTFLASYFGLSAATIAERLLRRQPMDVMRSSPHETEAYAIGARFGQWLQSR